VKYKDIYPRGYEIFKEPCPPSPESIACCSLLGQCIGAIQPMFEERIGRRGFYPINILSRKFTRALLNFAATPGINLAFRGGLQGLDP
jgi:hypothetical protein